MNGKVKCDICKNHSATFHLTEIINGKQKEVHLCEKCYQEKIGFKQFSLADLLSGLAKNINDDKKVVSKKSCPTCGITFREFQERGRFGCSEDYKIFENEILEMLDRLHGATEHCGKVPHQQGKDLVQQKHIRQLERELKKAIASENYEKAAELRDKITELKGK